jgi:hypothetical protein
MYTEDMIEWIRKLHSGLKREYRPRVRTLEIAGAIFTDFQPINQQEPDTFGVTIRRVPKETLGYRVLGRAFPGQNVVEISDELKGDDFEEVKLHELLHIQDPFCSEYNIRARTRDILGRTRFQ